MKGLFKRKGGENWYYQPPTIKGMPRAKAVALRTTREVDAIEKANKILHGCHYSAAQLKDTLEVILPRYYEAKSNTRKWSRQSREAVLGNFKLVLGNPRLVSITRQDILDWRVRLETTGGTLKTNKPLSFTSVTSYTVIVVAFFNWCVKVGLIEKSPAENLGSDMMQRRTRRLDFHTIEERERLLALPTYDYVELVMYLGFFAGLRVGEMLAINPEWLYISDDWSYGSIKVQPTPIEFKDGTRGVWKPKTKRGLRTIPMHPRLLAFLRTYGIRSPFLLAPEKTKFPNDDMFSMRFHPKISLIAHGNLCGVSTGFHKLRHSFATHLAMGGAHVSEIAMLMGNSIEVAENSYMGFVPRKDNALPGL